MSRTEKSWLRLLATRVSYEHIPCAVVDLCGQDQEGRQLLCDWRLAVFAL